LWESREEGSIEVMKRGGVVLAFFWFFVLHFFDTSILLFLLNRFHCPSPAHR
jgi:hypothetical protein